MNNTQKIEFIAAIKSNNLSRIKSMITKDTTLLDEVLNSYGSSALHLAAQYSTAEITTFLIRAYHDNHYTCFLFFLPGHTWLNTPNLFEETPLQLAIVHHQIHNIEPLVHAGATLEPGVIHLAAFMGHLKVVQKLLHIRPSLLNAFNNEGQTPLMAAIRSARAFPVVEFLLEAGADPYLASDCPEHPMHNKPPFLWAIEYKNNQAISIMIRLALESNDQSRLFNAIKSGEQALELMRLNPENIQLILRNTKIKKFIQTPDAYATDTSISFYRLSSKDRSSFFADVNPETGGIDIFHPHKFLGKGGFGSVRAFINNKQELLAIKTPLGMEDMIDEINDYKKEVNFLNIAYNTNTCRLFTAVDAKPELRTVMPYVPGVRMDKFILKTSCNTTIAQCILQATKALMSLHEKNIIHGDVKPNNILISTNPTLTATFVDFGFSYQFTDKHAKSFDLAVVQKTKDAEYIAPERFYSDPKMIPKPHTNQDIYSFAYMLPYDCIPQRKKIIALTQRYPCIQQFITRAVSSQPDERPPLASFHHALSHAIEEHTNQVTTAAAIR